MNRLVFGTMLTVLLIGMLGFAFNVHSSCNDSFLINASSERVEGWAAILEMNSFPEGWSSLPCEFTNSKMLLRTLTELGWQTDHIYVKRDNLTMSNVKEAAEWLVNNTSVNDVALLYIFTHGNWMRKEILWNDWFPSVWQKLDTSRKILMIDTCHAGEFIGPVRNDPEPHVSLAACSADELGWAGIPEEGLPIIGSVWNYYITNALCNSSADSDKNGFVSVEEAFNFSTPLVQKYMNETVFTIPEFLKSYHDIGVYPENYDAYPHPVMDDQYPGQLYLDLRYYSFLGKAYLKNIHGLTILHVKGSPYEMGYQQGVLLKDRVQWAIQFYLYDPGIAQYGLSYDYLVRCSQSMEPYIPEEYIEEMQGLADGSNANYTDVLLYNLWPLIFMYGPGWTPTSTDTIDLCSDFVVFGNATADQHLYYGKNTDWSLPPRSDLGLITVYEPNSGNSWVSLGYSGFTGVRTVALNEKGIAIDNKGSSSSDKTLNGMHIAFMLEKAIQYSNNLSEAINILNQTDRTLGISITIADGNASEGCAVEASDNIFKVFWAGDPAENIAPHYAIPNAIRRSNHFVDPQLRATQSSIYDPRGEEWTWSWNRYDKLGQLILNNYGQIDAEKTIKFLQTSPISDWSGGNWQSVVIDLTDLELWVAYANTTTPAYLRDYVYLSRGDLFPLETDLNGDGTVNILDITIVAAAYNTRPGDEKWNAAADLDGNEQINILDIAAVAKDYGKTV